MEKAKPLIKNILTVLAILVWMVIVAGMDGWVQVLFDGWVLG